MEINYVLIRVEIDGNGVRDNRVPVNISDKQEKLVSYCTDILKKEIGKPEKFSWDDYYVIDSTNLQIV